MFLLKAFCVLVFAALLRSSVHAATESPYVVQQPIVTEDAGVLPFPVTFTVLGELWASPGWTVTQTLAESRVWTTRHGFENRNAANLAALQISLVPHSGQPKPMIFPGLYADTLRAVLDVSEAVATWQDRKTSLFGYTLEAIVPATIECFQLNLKQEYPRIRFLDLRVVGSDSLAHLSGVFAVRPQSDSGE